MAKRKYYSGGLAEIVYRPTDVTYRYLKYWLRGDSSLGSAFALVGLPYRSLSTPVVKMVGGELVVDLASEQSTFYGNTIFSYSKKGRMHEEPRLRVSVFKLLNPLKWPDTLKILATQAKWIKSPQKSVELAKDILRKVPEDANSASISVCEKTLREKVWPAVYAVGILAEFYNHLIRAEFKKEHDKALYFAAKKSAQKDWFYLSIADQEKVQKGEWPFDKFIQKYGIRADNDYELMSPRWHEMSAKIKERIAALPFPKKPAITDKDFYNSLSKKNNELLESYIALLVLRSEARRKALIWMDCLRKRLQLTTRETPHKPKAKKANKFSESGQGKAISKGAVRGEIRNIFSAEDYIPAGSICVFPNANPEFSMLYTKAAGIIFIRGGQTSHGAIVAREFGIPAIVEPGAEGLPDKTVVEIEGAAGTWRLVKKQQDAEH